MTKYVECWGADRPFANIAESKLVKNIGLAVSKKIPFYHFNRKIKPGEKLEVAVVVFGVNLEMDDGDLNAS